DFTATVCPSFASWASHTRPKPPAPRRRISRKRGPRTAPLPGGRAPGAGATSVGRGGGPAGGPTGTCPLGGRYPPVGTGGGPVRGGTGGAGGAPAQLV